MKAKDLMAKLNKLVELKPDANIYFYTAEDDIEFIAKRLSEGKHLSDIGFTLTRTYEGGEGLISIDTESELI